MKADSVANARRAMLEVYQHAIDAVHGARVVEDALRANPVSGVVSLIAIGKAACAMARGAHAVLGPRVVDAMVVTRRGQAETLPWPVLEAAHPVPDESSLRAGEEIGRFVRTMPENRDVMVLLSGGASSLVEQLRAGVSLEDLQAVNRWLLGSGLDIHRMNAIRRRLSQIKGGGLARQLYPRRVRVLAISDVPGDRPASIGSGPLTRFDETTEPGPLPDFLNRILARTDAVGAASHWPEIRFDIVATNRDARTAAAAAVTPLGWSAMAHEDFLGGDAATVGEQCARQIIDGPAGIVHIWGSETTVRLPEQPGRGGRCQQLALSAARFLADHDGALLLAAASDGSDGPGDDAGALVDSETSRRASIDGYDIADALRRADAGQILESTGDLVVTGPTGTNVMDLVLGLRL